MIGVGLRGGWGWSEEGEGFYLGFRVKGKGRIWCWGEAEEKDGVKVKGKRLGFKEGGSGWI